MATWQDRFQELSEQQGRAFDENIRLGNRAAREAGIDKVRHITSEITAFFNKYIEAGCPNHDAEIPD